MEATAYGGCSSCNGPRLAAGVSTSTVSDDPTPSQVYLNAEELVRPLARHAALLGRVFVWNNDEIDCYAYGIRDLSQRVVPREGRRRRMSSGTPDETRGLKQEDQSAEAGDRVFETDIPARLERLPWGRFHVLVIAALGITWILDGLEVTLAGSVAGALKASPSLRFTDTEAGLAGSAYLMGAVIGALGFGWFGRNQLQGEPEGKIG